MTPSEKLSESELIGKRIHKHVHRRMKKKDSDEIMCVLQILTK